MTLDLNLTDEKRKFVLQPLLKCGTPSSVQTEAVRFQLTLSLQQLRYWGMTLNEVWHEMCIS